MAGFGGLNALTVALGEMTPRLDTLLQMGQVQRAIVRATPNGLTIHISNVRIPVPIGSGLTAGQTVDVNLETTDTGQRLRVVPRPGGSPDTPAASRPALPALVATILQTLGAAAPERAGSLASLVPPNLPLSEATVRAVLQLFTAVRDPRGPFETIARVLNEAIARGVRLPEFARSLVDLVQRLSGSDTQALREVIEAFVRSTGETMEARLAKLVQQGAGKSGLDPASLKLEAQLVLLRDHEGLVEFLRETKQLPSFREAVDQVLERLTGSQLQNARGSQFPYFFVELPLQQEAFTRAVQIHIFGEGKGDAEGERSATVVVDVELTELGPLWIRLHTYGEVCECRVDAVSDSARGALKGASEALRDSLSAQGYSSASVQVGAWDGERLSAVTGLMNQLTTMDVTA